MGLRIRWAVWTAAGAFALGHAVIAARHSDFVGDDMSAILALCRHGPLEFVLTPVNVHVVPLFRAMTWLLYGVFGLRFAPMVATLFVIHALGGVLMHRVLAGLMSVPQDAAAPRHAALDFTGLRRFLSLALTFAYATSPMAGVQLLWLSSGLHRFPYVLATLFAFERWLSFRRRRQRGDLVWIGLSLLVACGFYSKGPMLVAHLALLEVCLWPETSGMDRRRHARSLAALLVAAVMLGLANLLTADQAGQDALPKPSDFVALAHATSWTLAKSLVGGVGRSVVDGVPTQALACFGFLIVGLLAALSIAARRWNLVVWLAMAIAVLSNAAVIALSNRWTAYGLFVAYSPRFVLEQLVVVIPMLGLALRDLDIKPRLGPPAAALTSVVLVVSAAHGLAATRGELARRYQRHALNHAFLERFKAELARVEREVPADELVFHPGPLPHHMRSWGGYFRTVQHLATIMGRELVFSRQGRLRVTDQGSIVRANGQRGHDPPT